MSMPGLRRQLIALFLLSGMAIGACSHRGESSAGTGAAEPLRTVLQVENDNFLDMNIYVLPRAGARVRLGTVTGKSRATFTLPQDIVLGIASLRFVADPIGSDVQPVTEEIQVSQGDTIVMRIPAT